MRDERYAPATNAHGITPADVIITAADIFGYTVAELLGGCRDRDFIRVRHVAMYVARQQTPASYPELGAAFRRDHTTVLHAVDRIASVLRNGYDDDVTGKVDMLTRTLLRDLPPAASIAHAASLLSVSAT